MPPDPFGSIVSVGPAPTIKLPDITIPPTDNVPFVVILAPVMLPELIVPLVEIVFDPNAAKKLDTLVLL